MVGSEPTAAPPAVFAHDASPKSDASASPPKPSPASRRKLRRAGRRSSPIPGRRFAHGFLLGPAAAGDYQSTYTNSFRQKIKWHTSARAACRPAASPPAACSRAASHSANLTRSASLGCRETAAVKQESIAATPAAAVGSSPSAVRERTASASAAALHEGRVHHRQRLRGHGRNAAGAHRLHRLGLVEYLQESDRLAPLHRQVDAPVAAHSRRARSGHTSSGRACRRPRAARRGSTRPRAESACGARAACCRDPALRPAALPAPDCR